MVICQDFCSPLFYEEAWDIQKHTLYTERQTAKSVAEVHQYLLLYLKSEFNEHSRPTTTKNHVAC
jgi:hypothetical protein